MHEVANAKKLFIVKLRKNIQCNVAVFKKHIHVINVRDKNKKNVKKRGENVSKRLIKMLLAFAINPTIILAHWVICRLCGLLNFFTCILMSTNKTKRPFKKESANETVMHSSPI